MSQVACAAGQTPAVAKHRQGFPFPLAERGMATTDSALRVLGHPHVFAIGDTATAEKAVQAGSGVALPATAQVSPLSHFTRPRCAV
jgi:NADH dehydrogenase FAD-containing subunit